MVNKSLADRYSPALFNHHYKRFNQEDIYMDELISNYRNLGSGNGFSFNSTADGWNKRAPRSYRDKGLYDDREVGFVY